MKKSESATQPVEVRTNNTLPALWVDGINLNVRDDGICFLRLMSGLPDGVYEQARVMTSVQHLKEITSMLCNTLNHYPERPANKERK